MRRLQIAQYMLLHITDITDITDITAQTYSPITAPTMAHTQPFSMRLSTKTVLWLIRESALIAHSNAHFSDCWAIRTRTLIRRRCEVLRC